MNEIMNIRYKLGLIDMCGTRTYHDWCKRVDNAIWKMEKSNFETNRAEMKTLLWYNTPFNNTGKIPPYINGSKASNILFNIKAGSWVLKKTNNEYIKCKLCGENDNEIHRVLKCNILRDLCKESGLTKVLSDLKELNHTEVEIMGALTKGSKAECLERGRMLLKIDQIYENLGEQSLVDSAGDNAVMAMYGNSITHANSNIRLSALAET